MDDSPTTRKQKSSSSADTRSTKRARQASVSTATSSSEPAAAPAPAQNHFRSALASFQCHSALFPNDRSQLAKLHDGNTVADAMRMVAERRIQAVPVVRRTDETVLSVLSVADLVQFVLEVFSEDEMRQWTGSERDVLALAQLSEKPLMQLPMTQREAVKVMSPKNTLLEAAETLVRERLHRIVVLDEQNRPCNFITQSRLLTFANAFLDSIPNVPRTLRSLGIQEKPVVSIREDALTRQAFKLMDLHRVSAVGVVNADGALSGVISLTDIKRLGFDFRFFQQLQQPCRAFLDFLEAREPLRSKDPLCCTMDTTLGSVVRSMVFHGVHRIFIVDDYYTTRRPVGVVAMQEALEALIRQ